MSQQTQNQQGGAALEDTRGIIQQLVEAFGIQDLPEDKQQEVLSRAGKIIFKRLFLKVANTLSEENRNAFDSLLGRQSKPSQEEIAAFLKDKIVNFDGMIQNEISDFKGEFNIQ